MPGVLGSGSLVNLTQSGFTSLLDLPTAAPPLRQSELAIESICKDVSADVDIITHASVLISKVNVAYLRACVEVDYKSEAETAAKSLTALERPECNQATDCTIARTAGRRKSAPETAAEGQADSRLKYIVGPKRRRIHEAEPASTVSSEGTVEKIIDEYLKNSRGPSLSDPEGALEDGPDRGDLRQLGDEIFRQRSQMHTVPQSKLLDLLTKLEAVVARGNDVDFSETDEEGPEVARSALYSLDACIASLLIMNSQGAQQQIVLAEKIAGITGLIKKQLLLNIAKDDQGYIAGGTKDTQKSKESMRASAGHKLLNRTASKLTLAFTSRLQRAIKLLGSLLYTFPLEEQHIMPLVRVASQTLTATKMGVLQAAATGLGAGNADLIAASFSQYTQHRDIILDDILGTIVPNLPTVKKHLRKGYKEGQSPTYTLLSVVMRVIQESVKCPGIESAMHEWHASYLSAIYWADYFLKYFFSRISSGRAAKGELEVDIKAVVEHIISDLLAAYSKPELPVAGLLLQRLHAALWGTAGLQHPESHVKLVCIDLLAMLGTQLFCDATVAEQLTLNSTIAVSSDSAAITAVLDYLADYSCTDRELSASAQHFRLCQCVTADILPKHKDELNARMAIEEVVRRNRANEYMSKCALDSGDARRLVQIEMQKNFKRLRVQNLKWLQTCIEARDSGPQIRAKSVRALSMFIQADARLLASKEVAACFETALKDDSPSVRLESINMLGAHITDSRDLKDAYFDILASATKDQSVGVRKAALKIVWEAYMATTACMKAGEACGLLLQHVADPEESIQDQVAKYFHGFWFCADHSLGAGINDEERAARMVKVAESVIANNGPGRASQILVPLEIGHPFVDGLKKALKLEQRLETRLAVGQRLAAALLEGFLAAQGADYTARQKALPFLLALHALTVSEVQFCIPPDKPARFLECLAPYLKCSGAQSIKVTENEGNESARNEAEQLIYLMSILSTVLPGIQGLSSQVVDDMKIDLMNVIRCHKFRAQMFKCQQVVAAACETLCRLHHIEKAVGVHMARLAARYLELLEDWRKMDFPSKQSPYARRCMYVLGQMLRHGADVIEAKSEAIDHQGPPLNLHTYFGAISSICLAQKADLAMREQALRSLGMLGLAKSEILLSNTFRKALSNALNANADPRMQRAGLGVVLELLKAESKSVTVQQKASQRPGKGNGEVAKQRDTMVVQNEGSDVLSSCGGLLQENLSRLLDLMTCTASSPTTNVCTEALAASIRHSALQVAETVEISGVLPPWTFLPQLFALTTDPSRDCPNATLSFRVLRNIAAKHPEMLHRSVRNGLEQASQFHQRLRISCVTAQQSMVLMQHAVSGLNILYSEVLEVTKNGTASFMTAVQKKVEAACSFDRPAGADIAALQFFAVVVAQLPVKRGAEVLMLVQPVIHLISQHGDDVLAAAKAVLQSKASQQSWRQPSKVCAALTVLLSLCGLFAQKYSLAKDKLTSYKLDVGKKRHEGNMSSQRATEWIEWIKSVPLALDIDQLQEQVDYVEVLLEKFNVDYGYMTGTEAALEPPEDLRLGTADSMDWQAESTARGAEKRKSFARKKAVCQKGKRKSRGKKSVGDVPVECFEDPEDEDYHI